MFSIRQYRRQQQAERILFDAARYILEQLAHTKRGDPNRAALFAAVRLIRGCRESVKFDCRMGGNGNETYGRRATSD